VRSAELAGAGRRPILFFIPHSEFRNPNSKASLNNQKCAGLARHSATRDGGSLTPLVAVRKHLGAIAARDSEQLHLGHLNRNAWEAHPSEAANFSA
jgi:hypothetical protein